VLNKAKATYGTKEITISKVIDLHVPTGSTDKIASFNVQYIYGEWIDDKSAQPNRFISLKTIKENYDFAKSMLNNL